MQIHQEVQAMKKKIKDLNVEDVPKCWSELFVINHSLMVLFTENKELFENAKTTIPNNLLELEVEV